MANLTEKQKRFLEQFNIGSEFSNIQNVKDFINDLTGATDDESKTLLEILEEVLDLQ